MNYLYIPELNNLAINMDNISRIYIKEDPYSYKWYLKLRISAIASEEWSMLIPKDKLDTVKYRMDMFFLNRKPKCQ